LLCERDEMPKAVYRTQTIPTNLNRGRNSGANNTPQCVPIYGDQSLLWLRLRYHTIAIRPPASLLA